MTTIPTANDAPVHVEPLHNPSQTAQAVVPQAPLGNSSKLNGSAAPGPSQAPGLGTQALLAKRMAKIKNPVFVSPTDNLMTPCTQKITAAKKKNFDKSVKPAQLFSKEDTLPGDDEEDSNSKERTATPLQTTATPTSRTQPTHDEESPF